jgi:chorismate mutase
MDSKMTEKLKELNRNINDISKCLNFNTTPWVIAGPCSAESEQQMISTAQKLEKSPFIKVFRAGIWKPRTRPNHFEGIGSIGLEWLKKVKAETSLLTTTEVANPNHVELCLKSGVDILWVGARTTVNPFLVQEIADVLKGVDIPVLVKNPVSAEIGLWVGAIERLYNAGIRKIAAIHRGFYTYDEMQYRNSPRWEIPIELKRLFPDLPLICDPSHISGDRALIEQVSQMAMDFGIKGLMIESHIDPDHALSDAQQQVTPDALIEMLDRLKIRDAEPADRELKAKIAHLRASISHADTKIIQALAERMKYVEEIGLLKHEHNIPVLQLDRWESLLTDHIAKAQKMGLDSDFIKSVFELIHAQSVEKQL